MGSMVSRRLGAAMVGLAFVATACGTQTKADEPSVTPSEAADVEQLADQTLAEIGGNAEQREAKHYLTFRALNQPFEDCMLAQGVDYHAEYHTITAGFVPNGTSGTWMGALHRKPSELAVANAEAAYDDAVSDVQPEEKSLALASAKKACEDATGGENQVVHSDSGRDELVAAFTWLMDGVEEQLGPIAPYTECMKSAGIDYTTASDGEEGWAGLYLYLTGQMPRPPLPGDQPDGTWSQYLELEQRSLDADAVCRGDQYLKGLEILGPKLEEFRDLHAGELQASGEAWDAYVGQAKAQGFTWQETPSRSPTD